MTALLANLAFDISLYVGFGVSAFAFVVGADYALFFFGTVFDSSFLEPNGVDFAVAYF